MDMQSDQDGGLDGDFRSYSGGKLKPGPGPGPSQYDDASEDDWDFDNISASGSIPGHFVCDEPGCGKVFAFNRALAGHMRVHKGSSATRARQTALGIVPKPKPPKPAPNGVKVKVKLPGLFACNFCGKRFSTEKKLSIHVQLHNGPGAPKVRYSMISVLMMCMPCSGHATMCSHPCCVCA